MASAAFTAEMSKKRGSNPRTKIEHITKANVVTDISSYFLSGANMEIIKERAPDEIQAGGFDVVLSNHDDKFSEFVSGSLFFGTNYHGDRIRVSQGFLLPDGTEEYETQAVGYIDALVTDSAVSNVTIRCRDLLWRIMDQKLHQRPSEETGVAGASNVGDGIISAVSTKPFAVVNENWTLTCTLSGGDGVATFSVVGDTAGNIGTATSGTEFVDASNGIRFTITGGATNWALNDVFTFSSKQYPQWSGVNAGKIIWSILTGYNWDTDTQENWADQVFDFDRTQSAANTDLDYQSFVDAISNLNTVGFFNLTGRIPYDSDAVSLLQGVTVQFLGSLFTGNDGKIKLKAAIPVFGAAPVTFSDDKKITTLGHSRNIDEVINSVTVEYKATDDWPWSNASLELDGFYGAKDAASIANYKAIGVKFQIPWYTTTGQHAQDFASKLLVKYDKPPANIDFATGMDALMTNIGDKVIITDTKYGLNAVFGEISRVSKEFDAEPAKIEMTARRDSSIDSNFGFIGSETDEGDGISPQSDSFGSATDQDKFFTYLGDEATSTPDYRMY